MSHLLLIITVTDKSIDYGWKSGVCVGKFIQTIIITVMTQIMYVCNPDLNHRTGQGQGMIWALVEETG